MAHPKTFRRQLEGYGLTTAQILYRLPDHPSLLQTYVWQDYDLCPKFPALNGFLTFWLEKLEGPLHSVTVAHSRADQAGGNSCGERRVPLALNQTEFSDLWPERFQISRSLIVGLGVSARRRCAAIRQVASVPDTIDFAAERDHVVAPLRRHGRQGLRS